MVQLEKSCNSYLSVTSGASVGWSLTRFRSLHVGLIWKSLRSGKISRHYMCCWEEASGDDIAFGCLLLASRCILFT